MEIVVHFPQFAWLDSLERGMVMRQLSILLMGLLLYSIGIAVAYKISAKRFEMVDL